MPSRLPLSALLSHLLVAFTVEFDNEAEHRLPHRTSNFGSTAGVLYAPWLVSMAMWFNCMQHIREQGIRVRDLTGAARSGTNLKGMLRWGYVYLEPDPLDPRPKPPQSAWIMRATPAGRRAQEIWRPLFGTIEERWRERFGSGKISQLREALIGIAARNGADLPDSMPILGYGLSSTGKDSKLRVPAAGSGDGGSEAVQYLPLPALLARVLLAFAREFEREFVVSLAICANFLRVLDDKPRPLRDLPVLSGASKELVSVGIGYLERHGFVITSAAPAPYRGEVARLNEKGLVAQDGYWELCAVVEKRWGAVFSDDAVNEMRGVLESIAVDGTVERSPLFAGLEPYPEGWRAQIRRPATLPHYPLVSHRGGFPDGS